MTHSGVEFAACCHCPLSAILRVEAMCPDYGALLKRLPGTEWPGWLSQLPMCQNIALHETAKATLSDHWGVMYPVVSLTISSVSRVTLAHRQRKCVPGWQNFTLLIFVLL